MQTNRVATIAKSPATIPQYTADIGHALAAVQRESFCATPDLPIWFRVTLLRRRGFLTVGDPDAIENGSSSSDQVMRSLVAISCPVSFPDGNDRCCARSRGIGSSISVVRSGLLANLEDVRAMGV